MKVNTIQDIRDFFRIDINQSYGPKIDKYAAEYNNDVKQVIKNFLIDIGTKRQKEDERYRNFCEDEVYAIMQGKYENFIGAINNINQEMEWMDED